MRFYFFIAIISLFFFTTTAFSQEKIFLDGNGKLPYLTVYKPESKKSNGIAVIVCSGGAYFGRANSNEGSPASDKLVQEGFTAFLLDYRTPAQLDTIDKYKLTLGDLQKALAYVRYNIKKFNIKSGKVGIMGFSAGGHLVTTIATHFKIDFTGNLKGANLRPDFLVAVYPVVSFADSLTHLDSRYNLLGKNITPEKIKEFSNELHVTDNTPPTYLVSAMDDQVVKVENSLYFSAALRQHHVPVELWLYAIGAHGFGINNSNYEVQWIDDCMRWIKTLSGR